MKKVCSVLLSIGLFSSVFGGVSYAKGTDASF
ncbi:putative membrane protein (plasmid) [Bacillus cereus E33L]|nr:putative membrane protein [Bacillus cereus E33L]